MSSRRIQNLVQRAERGELEAEEYNSLVEDLGLSEQEEAFMKMTGTSLIIENRGEEAVKLSEQLLEEKYTTDELIDEAIEEIEGLSEVYERHMGEAVSSMEYSADVIEEVRENIEEADSAPIYIDIDIHEGSSFWSMPDFSLFGRTDDEDEPRDIPRSSSVDDESKRDFLKYAAGAGAAGLGLAGGVFAYDELTDEPHALAPEDYDLYVSDNDEVDGLTIRYENSDTEPLNAIGDRLEQEEGENSDLGIGFKATLTDEFVDVNTGEDLIKRYHLGQTAYEHAKNEAINVTSE